MASHARKFKCITINKKFKEGSSLCNTKNKKSWRQNAEGKSRNNAVRIYRYFLCSLPSWSRDTTWPFLEGILKRRSYTFADQIWVLSIQSHPIWSGPIRWDTDFFNTAIVAVIRAVQKNYPKHWSHLCKCQSHLSIKTNIDLNTKTKTIYRHQKPFHFQIK